MDTLGEGRVEADCRLGVPRWWLYLPQPKMKNVPGKAFRVPGGWLPIHTCPDSVSPEGSKYYTKLYPSPHHAHSQNTEGYWCTSMSSHLEDIGRYGEVKTSAFSGFLGHRLWFLFSCLSYPYLTRGSIKCLCLSHTLDVLVGYQTCSVWWNWDKVWLCSQGQP